MLVAVLVAASLLGRVYGASFAIDNIYHSVWFITLWAVTAVAAMVYVMLVSRRATLVVLHASFVLVLLGAFVSFLTSRRGDMVLVQESAPASMFETADGTLVRLPFRLQLLSIDTVCSDGDAVPDDYIAHIVADDRLEQMAHVVSLNRPMQKDGYQLCIKGVDDGYLSLLVSYDTYGRYISYAGYAMVFVSFLMLFFDPKSGFNCVLQQMKSASGAVKCGSGKQKARLHKVPSLCSHLSSLTTQCVAESASARYSKCTLSLCSRLLTAFRFPLSASRFPLSTISILLCVLVCLLWYGRGVFPATNGAEALMLLVVFVMLFAVALRHKREFALLRRVLVVVSVIIFAIAACNLDGGGEVQPILRTPLLGVHVTTIIIAYALLACAAVNAVIALCTADGRRQEKQAHLGRLLLYPATMLLAGGIFIGAVWANLSWGRYWGWDPKEVWALVTLLVCSVAFHTRSLRFMARPVVFHIFCIVAFVAVLFTYFGVNYLLGGLHSYA